MFLNGNGAGESSHISIYIKILPGEYDDLLRWPFSHSVSFTLFDQSSVPESVSLHLICCYCIKKTLNDFGILLSLAPPVESKIFNFLFPYIGLYVVVFILYDVNENNS